MTDLQQLTTIGLLFVVFSGVFYFWYWILQYKYGIQKRVYKRLLRRNNYLNHRFKNTAHLAS